MTPFVFEYNGHWIAIEEIKSRHFPQERFSIHIDDKPNGVCYLGIAATIQRAKDLVDSIRVNVAI